MCVKVLTGISLWALPHPVFILVIINSVNTFPLVFTMLLCTCCFKNRLLQTGVKKIRFPFKSGLIPLQTSLCVRVSDCCLLCIN